jgi:hypothetical protein
VIRSIAIVPHPPLLVPELVGASVAEGQALRTACQQAVRQLVRWRWHAVGVGDGGPATVGAMAGGSFRGYGADVPVWLSAESAERLTAPGGTHTGGATGPAGAGGRTRAGGRTQVGGRTQAGGGGGPAAELPLPMLVAGWLRAQAAAVAVTGELVHPSTHPADCLARGKELADELHVQAAGGEMSLLVLADGASTHPAAGAGRVDARAAGFDEAVAAALAAADAGALAAIDADLAAELGAGGRAAWQVLAGVATGSGESWVGELLYTGAPYGAGYHVALWVPR